MIKSFKRIRMAFSPNPLLRLLLIVFLLMPFTTYSQFIKGEFFIKVTDKNYTPEKLQEFILKNCSYLEDVSVSAPFILKNPVLLQTYLLKFSNEISTDKLLIELKKNVFIEYVEQVPKYEFFYTPNDIQPQQYNLQVTQAELAWDFTHGNSNVVIAVVDDAILLSHQDLASQIWVNTGEIAGNNIDDDANGYVDDVNGWDAADNDNDPNPLNPTNSSFTHGTHCAGIATAATDNATGISSMGFNTTLMPVKIAESSSQNLTGAYQGVQYAIINNADVISMSWGGASYSLTYQAIFDQAYNQGIVCIAAAGNSNTSAPMYPASYNHVISVAATDATDVRATFSNYGPTIDVAAPGVNIYSTLAGSNSSYGNLSGTSMACPLVSGLAGLMISYSPGISPDDLEACLKSTCDNIDLQNLNYIGLLGAGRINAYQAMQCLKPITASFTSNMQEICPGNTVQFFDQSNNNPTSWNWSFPGGTPSTSTLQNPIVTYPTNGVYNVTLIVTNPDGADTLTEVNYILVGPPTATTSGSVSSLPGYPIQIPVYFTGTPPWSFSYSDGTNTYNVNNVYTNPYYIIETPSVNTTYTLLTVSDTNCVGTASGQFDAIMSTGCVNLINNGDFQNGNTGFTSGFPYYCSCTVGSICVGSEPRDKCSNTLWINDLWDHTYGDSTGMYLLIDGAVNNVWTQNVSVLGGVTYTFSFWVIRRISDPSSNAPSQTLDVIIDGNVIQTFNTAPAPVTDWVNYSLSWTAPTSGIIPFAITQTAGVSWNDWGLDDIELMDCASTPTCNLTADFTNETACLGTATQFTDQSIDSLGNIVNWIWDFGDGNTATGVQNPSHNYASIGTYNVQLIVYNNQTPVCADTIIYPVNVYNGFVLDINQRDTICVGDSIILNVDDLGCGATPYSYSWSPIAGLSNPNILNPTASPIVNTNYILTVTDSLGNTVSDTVFIVVDLNCCKYQIEITGQNYYCKNDSIQLAPSTSFDPNANYEWNFGPNASPSSFIGFNPPPVFIDTSMTEIVSLIISGVCESDTAYFAVTIFPDPILPQLNDTTICGMDTIQVGETAISTYFYSWTPSGVFDDPTIANPLAYIVPPVTLYVEVHDTVTGCTSIDSMVIMGGFPYERYDTLQICQGDSVFLEGNYQFNSGDFTDGLISSFGCDSIVYTSLTVLPQSNVSILNNDTIISRCSSMQLIAIGASDFTWYPTDGLNCSNCSSPQVTLSSDIIYVVVGNENTCPSYDTINIQVIPADPLFIPNVFSPNEDGQNEIYKALGGCIESLHLQIYNRWGQLMFESFDLNFGWDGKAPNGELASEGTYYYIFEITTIENGAENLQFFNGSLTLIR